MLDLLPPAGPPVVRQLYYDAKGEVVRLRLTP
jgi:hypothetical protein